MMNQERSPLVSIHKLKIKCPVCGHRDNCAVSQDRCICFCRRVRSDKPGRGGWLHILNDAPVEVVRVVTTPRPVVVRAGIEHLHCVYDALLREHLVLTPEHVTNLRARGLSDFAIKHNCYRSTLTVDSDETAERAERIGQALARLGLVGVPGFQCKRGVWGMVRTWPGFFVPYRDERGWIQAMQYRLDEPFGTTKYLWLSSPECSSGAPVHHAYYHLLADAEEVTITEGALKADVIAHFTQAPVIGIAGVSTFGAGFSAHLRTVAPRLRSVVVAYDMDLLVKSEVLRALESLTTQLQQARFRVRVRTWPRQWKGFDDYLLAQFQQQEVRAA